MKGLVVSSVVIVLVLQVLAAQGVSGNHETNEGVEDNLCEQRAPIRSKREIEHTSNDTSHQLDSSGKAKSKSAKTKLAAVCKSGKASRNILKAIEQENSNEDSGEKIPFMDVDRSSSGTENIDPKVTYSSGTSPGTDQLQTDLGQQNQGSRDLETSGKRVTEDQPSTGSNQPSAQNNKITVGETGSFDKTTAPSEGTIEEPTSDSDSKGSGQQLLDWFAGLNPFAESPSGKDISENGPTNADKEIAQEASSTTNIRPQHQTEPLVEKSNSTPLSISAHNNKHDPGNDEYIKNPTPELSTEKNPPSTNTGVTQKNNVNNPLNTNMESSLTPSAGGVLRLNNMLPSLQSQSPTVNGNVFPLQMTGNYGEANPEVRGNGEHFEIPNSLFGEGIITPSAQTVLTQDNDGSSPLAANMMSSSKPSAGDSLRLNNMLPSVQRQSPAENGNVSPLQITGNHGQANPEATGNREHFENPNTLFNAGINTPSAQTDVTQDNDGSNPLAANMESSSTPSAGGSLRLNNMLQWPQSQSPAENGNVSPLQTTGNDGEANPEVIGNGEHFENPTPELSTDQNPPSTNTGVTQKNHVNNPFASNIVSSSKPSAGGNLRLNNMSPSLQSQSPAENGNVSPLQMTGNHGQANPEITGNGEHFENPNSLFNAGINTPSAQTVLTQDNDGSSPLAANMVSSSKPSAGGSLRLNNMLPSLQGQSPSENGNVSPLQMTGNHGEANPEVTGNGEHFENPNSLFNAGINTPSAQTVLTQDNDGSSPFAANMVSSSKPSAGGSLRLNNMLPSLQSQSPSENGNVSPLQMTANHGEANPEVTGNGEHFENPNSLFNAGINTPSAQTVLTQDNDGSSPLAANMVSSSKPSAGGSLRLNNMLPSLQSQSPSENGNVSPLQMTGNHGEANPEVTGNGEHFENPNSLFNAGINTPSAQTGLTQYNDGSNPFAANTVSSSKPSAGGSLRLNNMLPSLQSQSPAENGNVSPLQMTGNHGEANPEVTGNGEHFENLNSLFNAGINTPSAQTGVTQVNDGSSPLAANIVSSSKPSAGGNLRLNNMLPSLQSQSPSENDNVSPLEMTGNHGEANPEVTGNGEHFENPNSLFNAGINTPSAQTVLTQDNDGSSPLAADMVSSSKPSAGGSLRLNNMLPSLQSQSPSENGNVSPLQMTGNQGEANPEVTGNGEHFENPNSLFNAGINTPSAQTGLTQYNDGSNPFAANTVSSSKPSAGGSLRLNNMLPSLQSQSPAENGNVSPLQMTANHGQASPEVTGNGEHFENPNSLFNAGINSPSAQTGVTQVNDGSSPLAANIVSSSKPSAGGNLRLNNMLPSLQSQSPAENGNVSPLQITGNYAEANPEATGNGEHLEIPNSLFGEGIITPSAGGNLQSGSIREYDRSLPASTNPDTDTSSTLSATSNPQINNIKPPLRSQSLTNSPTGDLVDKSTSNGDSVPASYINATETGDPQSQSQTEITTQTLQSNKDATIPNNNDSESLGVSPLNVTKTNASNIAKKKITENMQNKPGTKKTSKKKQSSNISGTTPSLAPLALDKVSSNDSDLTSPPSTSEISSSPAITKVNQTNRDSVPLEDQSENERKTSPVSINDKAKSAKDNSAIPETQIMRTSQDAKNINDFRSEPLNSQSETSYNPSTSSDQQIQDQESPLHDQSSVTDNNKASPPTSINNENTGSTGKQLSSPTLGTNKGVHKSEDRKFPNSYGSDPDSTNSEILAIPSATTNLQINSKIPIPQIQSLVEYNNDAPIQISDNNINSNPEESENSGSLANSLSKLNAVPTTPSTQTGATQNYDGSSQAPANMKSSSTPSAGGSLRFNNISPPLQSQSLAKTGNVAPIQMTENYGDPNPDTTENGEHIGTPNSLFGAGINTPSAQSSVTQEYDSSIPMAANMESPSTPSAGGSLRFNNISPPLQSQSLTENDNVAPVQMTENYGDANPDTTENGEHIETPHSLFGAGINTPSAQTGVTHNNDGSNPLAANTESSSTPSAGGSLRFNNISPPLQSQSLAKTGNVAPIQMTENYGDPNPDTTENGEHIGTPNSLFGAGINTPSAQSSVTQEYDSSIPMAANMESPSTPSAGGSLRFNNISPPLQSQSLTENDKVAPVQMTENYGDANPDTTENGEHIETPHSLYGAGINTPSAQTGVTHNNDGSNPLAAKIESTSMPSAGGSLRFNNISPPLQSQSLAENGNVAPMQMTGNDGEANPEVIGNGEHFENPNSLFNAGLSTPSTQSSVTHDNDGSNPFAANTESSSTPSAGGSLRFNNISPPLQSQSLAKNGNVAPIQMTENYGDANHDITENGEHIGTPNSLFGAGMNIPSAQTGVTHNNDGSNPLATNMKSSLTSSAGGSLRFNNISPPLQSQSLAKNGNVVPIQMTENYGDANPDTTENGEPIGTPNPLFGAGINTLSAQTGETHNNDGSNPLAPNMESSLTPSAGGSLRFNNISPSLQSQSLAENGNVVPIQMTGNYGDPNPDTTENGEHIGTPNSLFGAGINTPSAQSSVTQEYDSSIPMAANMESPSTPSAGGSLRFNNISPPLQSQSLTENDNVAPVQMTENYGDANPDTTENGEHIETPHSLFGAGINTPSAQTGVTHNNDGSNPLAANTESSSTPSAGGSLRFNNISPPLQSQSLAKTGNVAPIQMTENYGDPNPDTTENGEHIGTPNSLFGAGINTPSAQSSVTQEYDSSIPMAANMESPSTPSAGGSLRFNNISPPLQSQSLTENDKVAPVQMTENYGDANPDTTENGEHIETPHSLYGAGINTPSAQTGVTHNNDGSNPLAAKIESTSMPSAGGSLRFNNISPPLQSQSLAENGNVAPMQMTGNDGEANPEVIGNGEHFENPNSLFNAGLSTPSTQSSVTHDNDGSNPFAANTESLSTPSAGGSLRFNNISPPLQSQSLAKNGNVAPIQMTENYGDANHDITENGEHIGTPNSLFGAGMNIPSAQTGVTHNNDGSNPLATNMKSSLTSSAGGSLRFNNISPPLQSQSLAKNGNVVPIQMTENYGDANPDTTENGEPIGTPNPLFGAGINTLSAQTGETHNNDGSNPLAPNMESSLTPSAGGSLRFNNISPPLQSQSLAENDNVVPIQMTGNYGDAKPENTQNGENIGNPNSQFSSGLYTPTIQDGVNQGYYGINPVATNTDTSSEPLAANNLQVNSNIPPTQTQFLSENGHALPLEMAGHYGEGAPGYADNSDSTGYPTSQYSAGKTTPTGNGVPTNYFNLGMNSITPPLQSQSIIDTGNNVPLQMSTYYGEASPESSGNTQSLNSPASQSTDFYPSNPNFGNHQSELIGNNPTALYDITPTISNGLIRDATPEGNPKLTSSLITSQLEKNPNYTAWRQSIDDGAAPTRPRCVCTCDSNQHFFIN